MLNDRSARTACRCCFGVLLQFLYVHVATEGSALPKSSLGLYYCFWTHAFMIVMLFMFKPDVTFLPTASMTSLDVPCAGAIQLL